MKTVIISGASSGIGAATAKKFSDEGYFCILLGRTENKLDKVVSSLPNAKGILADFAGQLNFNELLSAVLADSKYEIKALINNAGTFAFHDFMDSGLKYWHEMFQVNVFSTVALTQSLVPYFKKHGGGAIVNVSSTLAHKGGDKTSAYSASKGAINNLTVSLALDLARHNIRVNAVCPGLVDTPIHSFHSLEASEKIKALDKMAPLQPLGRIGKPEEIAESIYFLASEKSAWTTGAILDVDGGINIK